MNTGASKWIEFHSRRFKKRGKVHNLYLIVLDIIYLPFLTFSIFQNTAHQVTSGDGICS
jgi:hypothetical protein